MKFFYPRLSMNDIGPFRLGGPGLANCMFLAAQAYVDAILNNGIFVEPSWAKFSIGPILRGEKDKRTYMNLFKSKGLTGWPKFVFLSKLRTGLISNNVVSIYGPYDLNGYFTKLNPHHKIIKKYFAEISRPEILNLFNRDHNLSEIVSIHIRMGDYPEDYRTPLTWYQAMINKILDINPKQEFYLFSDGTDEELKPILQNQRVKKVFYGNAYADMLAISHTKMLLASDSTFSAWGAFLGDVPIIFQKRHFPKIYDDRIPEYILSECDELPHTLSNLFS